MRSLLFSVLAGLLIGSAVLLTDYLVRARSSDANSYSFFADDQPANYTGAIEKSAPAVVNIFIRVTDSDYNGSQDSSSSSTDELSSASGVIVDKQGYILTNYHVIMKASSYIGSTVYAQLRNGKLYRASVVGYDKRTDIAVLKLTTNDDLPVIHYNPDRSPRLGDVVLAIGNPYNIGQTVTMGIISAIGRSGSGITFKNTLDLSPGIQEFIQTDAPINSGYSGGALVNTLGEFIGLNTATLSSVEVKTNGISFAIPARQSLAIMRDIIDHGRVIRGYLGIGAKEAVTDIAPDKSRLAGIVITSIDPRGPAHGILQPGDLIVSINNAQVVNIRQAMTIIADSRPDSVLNFTIVRDGERISRTVVLTEQL